MTSIAPLTPEWYAARRAGIGASEIAAVMGLSPWESPMSLYWRKVEGWEVEESDAMRTGTILEPAIADWAMDALDPNDTWVHLERGKLVAHPDREWELATPDRVVHQRCHDCDGHGFGGGNSHAPEGYGGCASCYATGMGSPPQAVLELKWTGSWDGWGAEGSDDVPVHYRCQVLWQCDVVGVDTWYIAVLGPSGFRLYQGRRDDKDIAVMVEAGRRFMARIAAGDPPPLDDHHATIDTLRRLHPELVDEKATVDDRIAEGYLRAARMRRLAEKTEKRYEALLRAQMGDARTAYTDSGRKVATHVITDVAAEKEPRGPHRKDYLLASLPRGRKS